LATPAPSANSHTPSTIHAMARILRWLRSVRMCGLLTHWHLWSYSQLSCGKLIWIKWRQGSTTRYCVILCCSWIDSGSLD